MTLGPVGQRITAKLADAFSPISISVIDESSHHAGHSGSRPDGESHFRVRIVAEAFRGKTLVERHRLINTALADELKSRVHALAIEAGVPDQALSFRRIEAADERFKAMLEAAELGIADLSGPSKHFIGLIDEAGKLVACGGYEIAGDAALLRSIAVDPQYRRSGLGAATTRHLMSEARKQGAKEAYLLTVSAAKFFANLGFRAVERAAVPGAIRETSQFTGTTCSAAAVMAMDLAG